MTSDLHRAVHEAAPLATEALHQLPVRARVVHPRNQHPRRLYEARHPPILAQVAGSAYPMRGLGGRIRVARWEGFEPPAA